MAIQIRNSAAANLFGADLEQNTGELHLSTLVVTAAMSPYAAGAYSFLRCNTVAGPITVNLPTAANNLGKVYAIKKVGASASAVTVSRTGADNIDSVSTTHVLAAQNDVVILCSNGVFSWYILSLA